MCMCMCTCALHMYVHYLLQEPLLAVSCHQPGTNMGRCRAERIRQTFGHPYASALNPQTP